MSYAIPGATHQLVRLADGIDLSVYEMAGDGGSDRPAIVFSHGFPDLAYAWRHQMAALSDAGYRVIAPDQRGYGDSSRPEPITDYDIQHLTGDLVGLLDHLGIERAVFAGHDWGGFLVWQMPLLHPDRVAGVIGLNTPYLPRLPVAPTEVFRMIGGDGMYILEFQEPGVADEILLRDVPGLFDALFRTARSPGEMADAMAAAPAGQAGQEAPTTFERIIAAPRLGEPLLDADEMAVYVDTFTGTGFTGGLNWYRNFDRNWETTPELDGAHIDGVPCLMVTAAWDPVLTPAMAQGMPDLVADLEMHELAACGHWTQAERTPELNTVLLDWLGRHFPT
jgi:pimeloyl-ACP methyl ester carboxylesterase